MLSCSSVIYLMLLYKNDQQRMNNTRYDKYEEDVRAKRTKRKGRRIRKDERLSNCLFSFWLLSDDRNSVSTIWVRHADRMERRWKCI
jgi:hypothetical protein